MENAKSNDKEEVKELRISRERFAVAMIRADLNVNKLAERANINRNTITAVRSGKSCSQKTAEKLAAGLGCQVSDLVSESDTM